jgi:GNAT superfamily N-acetyltransferase
VYVFSLEHLGLTAEIDEFFVLPSVRSHGLGDGLLHRAEAEFVRRGCTNVALQLGRGNDRARVF